MDNIHVPEGERLPLTSFVFHKCFSVYTNNLMALQAIHFISQLVNRWLPRVAIEDGTCTWDGPGSGEWDIPVGSFLGPGPLFMELSKSTDGGPGLGPAALPSSP